MWRAVLPKVMTKHMNPLDMPAWPRLTTSTHGTIVVKGRHLTPAGQRLTNAITAPVVFLLILTPLWYYFYHSRTFLDVPLHFLLAQLHYRDTNGLRLYLFLTWLFSGFLWAFLLRRGFQLLFQKSTVVRFSRDAIILQFFFWPLRYSRADARTITFFQTEHPGRAKWQRRAQQTGNRKAGALAQLYGEARLVVLQYGQNLVPVAAFIDQEKAAQFTVMCQQASAAATELNTGGAFEVEWNRSPRIAAPDDDLDSEPDV